MEADAGLKSIITTILGKFLSNRDPNYKYIALNTLREVAKDDLQSVQKHKNVILECLRDSDISIKRRALDLIYLIVNSSNIKQIMREYLNFLLTAESDFKLEITTKVNL
jgi:AP-1 complex subunit gamma-1